MIKVREFVLGEFVVEGFDLGWLEKIFEEEIFDLNVKDG